MLNLLSPTRVLCFLEIRGFEPLTYGLQSRRSSQLSYIPAQRKFMHTILMNVKKGKGGEERKDAFKRIDDSMNLRFHERHIPVNVLYAALRLPNILFQRHSLSICVLTNRFPFIVKGGDPAALSSTATLLRLHPPH